MFEKILSKIESNIKIYAADIQTKGVYWSFIHRLYKIPNMKKMLNPLICHMKPNHIIFEGSILYIDKNDTVISQELLQSGKWEEFETKVFKKNIKKGDIVLDIGAHIGYYTLIAAKIVGKKGKVYAFEPDTKNFSILQKNVEANGCANVVLINKAVSDSDSETKLFLDKNNTGDHRIYKSKDHYESIKINTLTLDRLFEKNKHIDLIKIDIQGAEVKALLGAKELVKTNNNIKIITEFWPRGLKLCGNSADEYLQFLKNNKFQIYEINENLNSLELVDLNKILKPSSYDNLDFKNLYCSKNLIKRSQNSS